MIVTLNKCVSSATDESVLMDLKALLIEAKQKVPPVLQVLQTGDETMLDIGGKVFTPALSNISLSLSLHSQDSVIISFICFFNLVSSFFGVSFPLWADTVVLSVGLIHVAYLSCSVFVNP